MYFDENIIALEKKNAKLAQELKQIYLVQAEENIEVYQSESGDYIFSYDGLMLDDISNPIEAAFDNISANVSVKTISPNDIVVVYGLASGYLLKSVCKNISAKIIFLEPKVDILRYGLEFCDFKNEFLLKNIVIASDANQAIEWINKASEENQNITVLYPESYLQLLEDELNDFISKVAKIVEKN